MKRQTPTDVIAIDGPSASGKSTVARLVARDLGWIYVDSGALYRAVTWKVLVEGLSTDDSGPVIAVASGCAPEFYLADGALQCRLDGHDLRDELRTVRINEHVSPVAAVPRVREQIVSWLRGMVKYGKLVVEGRDIGTAVFPQARFKFYLDAAPEERARRRHREMEGNGASLGDVDSSLKRRDAIDSTRKTAPLRAADDALVIDSTGRSIDEVVAVILATVKARPQGRMQTT
jgi:cytidylate kinase